MLANSEKKKIGAQPQQMSGPNLVTWIYHFTVIIAGFQCGGRENTLTRSPIFTEETPQASYIRSTTWIGSNNTRPSEVIHRKVGFAS